MSYYKNNEANRDALFGPPSSSGNPKVSRSTRRTTSRHNTGNVVDISSMQKDANNISNTASSIYSGAATGLLSTTSSLSSVSNASSLSSRTSKSSLSSKKSLTGAAKAHKMNEAEDYRKKAKKSMEAGIFSRPDPITAAAYYRKAAELYKQCGENRLERLHRIACADCQRGQESYASAALEYTRAAELAAHSDETETRKRNEVYQLNKSAADAYLQLNDKAKAGKSYYLAANGLLLGYEDNENNTTLQLMDRKSLTAFEEAVELHVPDLLNRFKKFRQTGKSAHDNLAIAEDQLVTAPYAHETLFHILFRLLQFNEYPSALYAIGAATKLLENEGATISLHRAYLTETIIQLVLKDVAGADKTFLETHLQRNSYLSSKECKLAEDLIRAYKSMDMTALDMAKLENRSALANLDPTVRLLVMNLSLTGAKVKKTRVKKKKEVPKKDHMLEGEQLQNELNSNFDEMNKMMEDMGLDKDEDKKEEEEEEEKDNTAVEKDDDDDDDDEVDLR